MNTIHHLIDHVPVDVWKNCIGPYLSISEVLDFIDALDGHGQHLNDAPFNVVVEVACSIQERDPMCDLFLLAAERGFPRIVKVLLEGGRVDLETLNTSALSDGSRIYSEDRSTQLHYEAYDVWHEHQRNGLRGSLAMELAAYFGHDQVLKVLLAHPGMDPCWEAFMAAIRRRQKHIIELFMQDPRVDPSGNDNEAICLAAQMLNNEEVVEMLLSDERVDPSARQNEPVVAAARACNYSVIRCLLTDERVDLSARDNEIICEASAKAGTLNLMKFLIMSDERVDPSARSNLPIRSASQVMGNVDVVQFLLEDERVDPSDCEDEALRKAACIVHNAEVVQLLLQDKRVSPDARQNEALRMAARGIGNLDVVKVLLESNRVDPSSKNNEMIRLAARSRNGLELIRLILKDPRVDPTVNDHEVLMSALNNVPLMRILLQDPRINAGARDNKAVIESSKKGRISVVRMLLQHESVDPTAQNNAALWEASVNGHADVVRLLLSDGRCHPAQHRHVIIGAVDLNEIEVVKALLEDERVDAAAEHNKPLRTAIMKGNLARLDIIELLLTKSCVDATDTDTEGRPAICEAALAGRVDAVQVFLEDQQHRSEEVFQEAKRLAQVQGYQNIVRMFEEEERLYHEKLAEHTTDAATKQPI